MPRVPPETSPHVEPRLTRVEASLEALTGDVQQLTTELRDLGTRTALEMSKVSGELGTQLRAIQAEFQAAARPNWQLWVSGIMLLIVLLGALSTAALAPLYLMNSHTRDSAQAAIDWQRDYQRGLILSPDAKEMAKQDQKFIEVETQFHAFKERMVENEEQMKAGMHRNQERLDQHDAQIGQNRERLSRIEEHLRVVTEPRK